MEPELAEQIYLLDRCIECGCCVAACGTARMREDFVGAVGLNRIARFRLDPRDTRERCRVLRADRRRQRRVRLHVAARLPRPVPEGSAAPDPDRLPATEDGRGGSQVTTRRALARRRSDQWDTASRRTSWARSRFPTTPTTACRPLRGKENFHITGMPDVAGAVLRQGVRLREEGRRAWRTGTSACSTRKIADAIIRACDRVIAGDMNDQFVTDFIQGGAGTSTNMNANEVIANLALESLGHKKGEYQYVNPNDHVNFGQSTNDVYPTAFHLGLILRLESYMEALRQLQDGLLRQGAGVRPGAQDGPHPPAGRGPDVAGRRVPRLGHDDRRGGAAHRRGPAASCTASTSAPPRSARR